MPETDPTPTADRAGHVCSTAELGPLPEPFMHIPFRDRAERLYTEDQLRAERLRCHELGLTAERERFVRIIEAYQVPVGNSAAGEMAAEWTMEALREIRDAIRGPDADERRASGLKPGLYDDLPKDSYF